MIWKNFARELGYTTSRLISVIIITAVAVLIQVALSSIIYNGDRIANDYFEKQNVANYWITGTGFDRSDYRDLKKIKGITDIQPRIVIDAEQWRNDDISLTLYAVADGYHINTPLIIEGDFPKSNREMMLSSEFAAKKNLHVGDSYEMLIPDTNQRIKKTICALIKSPECVFHINATTLSPDYDKFGFAYMNEDAFADVWGKNIYNQICIRTVDGISDAEIKNEINEALGNKVISITALEDNMNAYNLVNQTDIIRTIAIAFPIIFFLVALLIIFSTMSRLIENARTAIGTMKALGYYDRTLLVYYLLYSVLVVLAGFVIGVLPATEFITKPVMNILFSALDLPEHQVLSDKSAWVWALFLSCIFCIGTAFVVTLKALNEKPAECMRAKPPKKVKKLFLERLPFLWSRLSFSTKYIVRNIFRNKTKMFICIIGVTGCMALILSSFAVKGTVDNFAEKMTTNEHNYDVVLGLERSVTKPEYEHIGKMAVVEKVQYEMITTAKIFTAVKQETIRFSITDDVIELKLLEAYGPSIDALPIDGIVIEKAMADKLSYRLGDIAIVKFADSRDYLEMPIRRISEGINGVYVGRTYWRSLSKGFTPTSLYIRTSDIDTLEKRTLDFDFVSAFKLKESVTDAVVNEMRSMTTIAYILIVFGGVLALVVLYNLGIMSFYEQIRNLATLMVLGFYDKEIRKLLLTENIVFTVIGIILGTPLGIVLAKMLLSTAGTFTFEIAIPPLLYVLSIALTMLFALLVNKLIGSKMKTIDMLGALKSIE